MKAKINSNLFRIISVGMYGSHIAPDNLFDDMQITDNYEEGYIPYDVEYFWDNFDNQKFVKHVEEQADIFLSGKMKANGISIEIQTGAIYSPKYYNFATDEIDLDVTYNKAEVLDFAKENKDDFDAFLKEHYSSYDGFSSSTANNYDEWLEDFTVDNDQSIGAVLTYIFKDEMEESQEDFYNQIFENTYFQEFTDETKIDAEVQELDKLVRDKYPNFILEEENFEFEYLKPEAIERIVKEIIREIEDQTLKLEL